MIVKKCCCFVPIDKAIVCIGFWMCLTLLGQMEKLNPISAAANIAALVMFFIMMNKDTAKNREYFFYVFAIYMGVFWLVSMIITYGRLSDGTYIQKKCEEMQKDGTFKEDLITSMDECRARLDRAFTMALWVLALILGFVFLHLVSVVYTHWKNFGENQEPFEQQIDEENCADAANNNR